MGIVRNVVYLSKAQLDDLIANGTITVDGTTITYSPDDIYMTPTNDSNYIENGTMEDVSFGGNVAVGSGKLLKIEMLYPMTNMSISANSWATDSISANDVQTAIGSDWTPIGVVGVDMSGTGSTWCMLARFYVTTVSGLVVCVRNFSSSAASLTVKCGVLCIRTSL